MMNNTPPRLLLWLVVLTIVLLATLGVATYGVVSLQTQAPLPVTGGTMEGVLNMNRQPIVDTQSVTVVGSTGATAGTRYMGATVAGAPTVGSFVAGDYVIDHAGDVWVCVSTGSPGGWVSVLGTGVFLPSTGGTLSGTVTPSAQETVDLGTSTNPFAHLYTSSLVLPSLKNGVLWTDGSGTVENLAIGSGLSVTSGTLTASSDLSLSGLTNSLLYANASQVLSAASVSANLSFSGGVLDTVQDIQHGSSPTFAGLTLTGNLTNSGAFSISANSNTAISIDSSGNVTVLKDLTVNGTSTTINSTVTSVDSNFLELAANNSADSLDTGIYGEYVRNGTTYYAAFYRANGVDTWYLKDGMTVKPGNTVTAGTVAGLSCGALSASSLTLNGSTSGYSVLQSPATAGNVTWTLPSADGSNGQALVTNGGGILSWGAGQSRSLISQVVTSGSQSSVTFSSIPNTYTHLEVEWLASASAVAATQVQINAVSTGYCIQRVGGSGNNGASGTYAYSATNASYFQGAPVATVSSYGIVRIPFYTSSLTKALFAAGGYVPSSGAGEFDNLVGLSTVTATISQLTISLTTGTLTNGGLFNLYGTI